MGKSTLKTKLPPEILAEVDALIRANRTIDEIVAKLRELGSADISRSAVGRYKQTAEKQMENHRRAQEMARVWADRFGSEPQGDVGRLLTQVLSTVAFQTLGQIQEDSDGVVDPQDLYFLGKALKELEGARKTNVDREAKIREMVIQEIREKAEKKLNAIEAGGAKDPQQLLKEIRALYGIYEEVK